MSSQTECPAICTEKFRQPCCPRCPMVDKEHPPYGTWELAARLLGTRATPTPEEAKKVGQGDDAHLHHEDPGL